MRKPTRKRGRTTELSHRPSDMSEYSDMTKHRREAEAKRQNPVGSSELVVLRREWMERAKDCIQRAQAHAQVWGTGNDTYQRLMERAAVLQDCARDLEIEQHNDKAEAPAPQ